MNEDLMTLAQEAQRKHAALIEEAARRTSLEARSDIRNDLESLRQDFTSQALALTNVSAPFMWAPTDPDHAVAIAVRGDIADTEERLARLAAGAAFQKAIKTDFGLGLNIKLPAGTGPAIALGVVGLVLIVAAILVLKR